MVEVRCVMLGSGMEVEDFVPAFANILGAGVRMRRGEGSTLQRRHEEGLKKVSQITLASKTVLEKANIVLNSSID